MSVTLLGSIRDIAESRLPSYTAIEDYETRQLAMVRVAPDVLLELVTIAEVAAELVAGVWAVSPLYSAEIPLEEIRLLQKLLRPLTEPV